MKALLAERYLYAFGNRATVKKWKYRLKKNKDTSNTNADEHDQASDSNVDEEDVEITLQPPDQPRPHLTQQSFFPIPDNLPASNPFTTTQSHAQAPATTTRRSDRNIKSRAL